MQCGIARFTETKPASRRRLRNWTRRPASRAAVGDNERATRLSGVRCWQVITALYVISSVLVGTALHRPDQGRRSPTRWCCLGWPPPSSAAPRSSAAAAAAPAQSTALIPTALTTLLTILQMPEGAWWILFGLIVLFVTAAYLRIVEER
ncbi:hypothetical protein X772_12050 [Mesorhizobium sp. LSJC280B00]|nr:hypothetical protein X772_12050 [Mesorhizobium sp. LSJC280B00]